MHNIHHECQHFNTSHWLPKTGHFKHGTKTSNHPPPPYWVAPVTRIAFMDLHITSNPRSPKDITSSRHLIQHRDPAGPTWFLLAYLPGGRGGRWQQNLGNHIVIKVWLDTSVLYLYSCTSIKEQPSSSVNLTSGHLEKTKKWDSYGMLAITT